jgi:hypothetical protein
MHNPHTVHFHARKGYYLDVINLIVSATTLTSRASTVPKLLGKKEGKVMIPSTTGLQLQVWFLLQHTMPTEEMKSTYHGVPYLPRLAVAKQSS